LEPGPARAGISRKALPGPSTRNFPSFSAARRWRGARGRTMSFFALSWGVKTPKGRALARGSAHRDRPEARARAAQAALRVMMGLLQDGKLK